MLEPKLEAMSETYTDVKFYKLDVDEVSVSPLSAPVSVPICWL